MEAGVATSSRLIASLISLSSFANEDVPFVSSIGTAQRELASYNSPGLGNGQITRFFLKMIKWISNPKSIIDSRIISFLLCIGTLVKFKLSKSLTLDNGTDLSGSHFQTARAITVDGCIGLMQTMAAY